jgi:type II secretory ATPase GspE/PulE/Tfp pilus assembly ATPase PilB-like protein
VGCPACSHKGYRGRLALIELLRLDPTLDELVANNAPLHEIRRAAFAHGYHPLAEDGIQRVKDGVTSLAEVARVVDLTGRV